MFKRLALVASLLASSFAIAADNTVIVTPGTGVTMRSVDIGSGVQSMMHILGNATGTTIYGTAGTANAAVLSVQGITSGTPLTITGSLLTVTTVTTVSTVTTLTGGGVASGAADSGNPVKVGGKYNSSPVTLTDGNRGDLQLDVNGYLKVNVVTALGLAQGSTTSGQTGSMIMGAVTTAAPTYTTAQTAYMSLDTGGALRVSGIWQGVAAAAPPANVVRVGATGSGATGGLMAGLIQCDSKAIFDATTSGNTELVALTSGRGVYVCGYSILSAGTTNVKLVAGTGSACASGSSNLTPAFQLTAQVGIVDGSPFYRGLKTPTAEALCINNTATISVQAIVYYSVI